MNDFWLQVIFWAIIIAGVLVYGAIVMRLQRKAKMRQEGAQNQLAQPLLGFLLAKKARQSSVAYFFLFLSLILYWYLSALSIIPVRIGVLLFISALIIALFIGQQLLEYRIKKGLYGTNEYEAREIIEFILSNKDKSDFTGGKGFKEIFLEPEVKPATSADGLTDEGAEA